MRSSISFTACPGAPTFAAEVGATGGVGGVGGVGGTTVVVCAAASVAGVVAAPVCANATPEAANEAIRAAHASFFIICRLTIFLVRPVSYHTATADTC